MHRLKDIKPKLRLHTLLYHMDATHRLSCQTKGFSKHKYVCVFWWWFTHFDLEPIWIYVPPPPPTSWCCIYVYYLHVKQVVTECIQNILNTSYSIPKTTVSLLTPKFIVCSKLSMLYKQPILFAKLSEKGSHFIQMFGEWVLIK